MHEYDIAIIGAGINGCTLAYELSKQGQNLVVIEKNKIASGGSGAAGAFINPKITKAGELKELIEEAYVYSLKFYQEYFDEYTTTAPLLHISKYENDNDKVQYFKEHTKLKTSPIPSTFQDQLKPHALSFNAVYLQDNAVVEAQEICNEMLTNIDLVYENVEKPYYKEGFWFLGNIKAKKVVLCTGAYEAVFDEEYISLRRIYGQRCEIASSTTMDSSLHHEVSVSVTKKNGCIAIGASHYLDESALPNDKQAAQDLMALAQKSIELKDIEVKNVFTGMRAGSNDYLPLLGPLVDMSKSLALDESAIKGNKEAKLSYVKDVYMMNGVGGYGFVLAPYLASLLCEHLINKKDLPKFLQPERFYYRYAKKVGQK